MSQAGGIARGAGATFAGQVFGQAARFGFTLIVARLLGAEALGIYALAIALVQVAEVLASAGLDAALLRFAALHAGDRAAVRRVGGFAIKAGLMLSIPVALLFLAASGPLAGLFGGGRLLQLALACYGAALPVSVTTSLVAHAMQGCGRLQPRVVATQVLSPSLLLLLTLLFESLFGGEAALLFPFAVSALLVFLWIVPRLKPITGITPADILRASWQGEVVSFAVPLLVVSLSSMLLHWLDIVVLGLLSGPSSVGLYQPAARTAGLLRTVLFSFSAVAAPLFARLHGAGEVGELAKSFRLMTRWSVTVALPPTLFLLFFPQATLSLFGAEYVAAAPALSLLAAAAFVQAAFGLASTLLAMSGEARLSLYNALGALLLHLLLSMLLIPRFGMVGAGAASLLLFVLLSAVRLLQVRSLLALHPFSKSLAKPVAAGAATAALLWGVRLAGGTPADPWSVPASLLAVLVPYTLFLLLTGLEEDERRIILQAIEKLRGRSRFRP